MCLGSLDKNAYLMLQERGLESWDEYNRTRKYKKI